MRTPDGSRKAFHMLASIVLALLLCSSVSAISLRDAGVHDWHLPLIGQPHTTPELRARFHYPAGRSKTAVSSLVYTATEKNVLAAIEPRFGDIVWRHQFSSEQTLLKYVVSEGNILALTGPAAAEIHLLSASTGHFKWSVIQHRTMDGLLPEPGSLAADAVFLPTVQDSAAVIPDIISLSGGHEVRRIDSATGDVKWKWTLKRTEGSTLQLHRILPSGPKSNSIQILLTERLTGRYSLSYITLNLESGQPLSDKPIAIKNTAFEDLQALHVLSPLEGTSESRIAYLDAKANIVSIFFFDEGASAPILSTHSATQFVKLVSVDLESRGILVGTTRDGGSAIVQVESSGKISLLHQWRDKVTSPVYDGFVDRDGYSHVSRISISTVLGLASMSTYSVEASEFSQAGTVFASTFPYKPRKDGRILAVTAEIAPRKSSTLLSRTCITTASGSFQGWLGPGLQWAKEEGLAHISVNARSPSIAFLPVHSSQKPTFESGNEESPLLLIRSFVKSLFESATSLANIRQDKSLSTAQRRDWLKESFGYRKIIIAGSSLGKLYAIDLGDGGKILWENYLLQVSEDPFDNDSKAYRRVTWKKIAVFDQFDDGSILLVAIAEVVDSENVVSVQSFSLNGLTGHSFVKGKSHGTLFSGAVKDILILHGSANPTLLLVAENDNSVHVFSPPGLHVGEADIKRPVPQITITDTADSHSLLGLHTLIPEGEKVLHPEISWKFAVAPEETLQAVARQANGKIGSTGRVLGDRSTIYKYLNPHLIALATTSETSHTLSIHVLDAITGRLVWSTLHADYTATANKISLVLTDNWLVYSYPSAVAGEGAETILVSVELFEQLDKSDANSGFTSYSNVKPYALSRSFVFPAEVVTMTTSRTRFGVSTKSLIVATNAGQVVAIPNRYLDPRRPLQKPTKADHEEGLMAYEPVIPIKPKWVISHKYPLEGVQGILASPTVLESTSQILVWGLDLFGSSVSPSGRFDVLSRDFNKVQLVATSLGLLGAIAILKPIVQKKQLKERWYPAS